MTKFMCIKRIAEEYNLSPDLQDLIEKMWNRAINRANNCIINIVSQLECEDERDMDEDMGYEKINCMRFLPAEMRNIKKGNPRFLGMSKLVKNHIDKRMSGVYRETERGYLHQSSLVIDGVPMRSICCRGMGGLNNAYILELKNPAEPCRYNGKNYWGLKKTDIVKLLQERGIKFNKSKKKADLIRILWSSKD
tara:strand:+ start:46 stop:624 length:579 start_codon:yes stop_codon:yes gene_type:complete